VQDVEETFAQRLKELRESMKLSQARLAALLAQRGTIDLDPTAITRIERRQRAVGLREAVAIADVLGVRLTDLCRRPSEDEDIAALRLALAEAEKEQAEAFAVNYASKARADEAGARITDLRERLAEALEKIVPSEPGALEPPGRPPILRLQPRGREDVRTVAGMFRAGNVVEVDLSKLGSGDRNLLLAFAAGMMYGRLGAIETVDTNCYRLNPDSLAPTWPDPAGIETVVPDGLS